jgi:hypothetical protein
MNMSKQTGVGMTKFWISLALAVSGLAFANTTENQNLIDDKVETIRAKKGVDIEIGVQSRYQNATIDIAKKDLRQRDISGINELTEFTQVDLDLLFRPWEATNANIVLRFYAEPLGHFNNPTKLVTAPWMNLSGRIGNTIIWTAGDFREQYSPLTLYAPEVEFLYEPLIFARSRGMAQDQEFIKDNDRVLQGLNLQYRKGFGRLFSELRLEGLASRLRSAEELDASGANGNLLPNEGISGASSASNMDKYLITSNLEMLFLNKDIFFGATFMSLFDDEKTFMRKSYLDPAGVPQAPVPYNLIDTIPQSTVIMAFRGGLDIASMIKSKSLVMDLMGEFANSIDAYQASGTTALLDDANNPVLDGSGNPIMDLEDVEKNGIAILADLNMGYILKDSLFKAVLNGKFISVDSAYFNPLAQSPTFIASRITNSEKDQGLSKYGVRSPYYSTFDALYNYNPKFTPSWPQLSNEGPNRSNTDSYQIAPYKKSSYTNGILNRQELELVSAFIDPAINMSQPFGPATPNREGIQGEILLSALGDDFEIKAVYSQLKEKKWVVTGIEKFATYTDMGVGAKADIGNVVGWKLPIEFSGSFSNGKKEFAGSEISSDMINAGFRSRFHQRFGVLFGYQEINQSSDQTSMFPLTKASTKVALQLPSSWVDYSGALLTDYNTKMSHWMAGMEYYLNDKVWAAINYGINTVENKSKYQVQATRYDTDDVNIATFGQYLDANGLPAGDAPVTTVFEADFPKTFNQAFMEVSVNARF